MMDRATLGDLAVFAAIVEAGGFAEAARRAGVSPSALSHAMRSLEARLEVRLLNRTTRSVAPTEAGAKLLAALRPALSQMDDALSAVKAGRDRPAGRVRISAHRTAAVHHVLSRLAGLRRDYPDIVVELVVEDGLVDIVAGGFDAGIRLTGKLEPDMIAVRLDDGAPVSIVAAPD
jgi:DNA-binding transcriptional LysR family regulator